MKLQALYRSAVVGGAVLALAVPSASARSNSDYDGRGAPAARPIGVVPQDLRNPDLREGHTVPVPYSPDVTAVRHTPASAAPRIVTTPAAGFDWRSAAIGGGVFAALVALGWLTATGIGRRARAQAAR